MTLPGVSVLDAAFALSVTGAGMSPFPWLALVVAAGWFGLSAFLAYRNPPPKA